MTTTKGNTMEATIKFIKTPSTEMVIDTTKPAHIGYVADVWHDDENARVYGRGYWNINNGTIYLWGFPTREDAVQAMIERLAS